MRDEGPDRPPASQDRKRPPRASRASPDRDWAAFRQAHADWLARLPEGEPVHRLPKALVAELVESRRIDDRARRAERDLERLCRRSSAVGFLGGAPVAYAPLAGRSSRGAEGRPARRPRAGADERVKGYAGWLLTEPGFLREIAEQRGRWAALEPARRPPFPFDCEALAADRKAAAEFVAPFAAFCRRWGLAGAAWWDLPVPQGLVVSNRPSAAARARGVHVFVPFHHRLGSGEDLVRLVRRAQEEEARAAGPDVGPAGLSRHAAFARMLEVQHWERVVAGRYHPGGPPAGFVADVVRAIGRHLGLREDQVRKWRKAISARRRGVPTASIPALKARP